MLWQSKNGRWAVSEVDDWETGYDVYFLDNKTHNFFTVTVDKMQKEIISSICVDYPMYLEYIALAFGETA